MHIEKCKIFGFVFYRQPGALDKIQPLRFVFFSMHNTLRSIFTVFSSSISSFFFWFISCSSSPLLYSSSCNSFFLPFSTLFSSSSSILFSSSSLMLFSSSFKPCSHGSHLSFSHFPLLIIIIHANILVSHLGYPPTSLYRKKHLSL